MFETESAGHRQFSKLISLDQSIWQSLPLSPSIVPFVVRNIGRLVFKRWSAYASILEGIMDGPFREP